jgi:hypothetical protein
MSMTSLWELFREAGPVAWLVVPTGLAGALGGLAALVLGVLRPRQAYRLGLAAAGAGILCAGLGGAGVAQGRLATDRAIAAADPEPAAAERLKHEGYRDARSAAGVGLMFAVLPLLAGVAAMLAGRRRWTAAEGEPEAAPPGARVPVGVGALGVVASGFALAALSAPLPGHRPLDREDATIFAEDLDAVQRAVGDERILRACAELEADLGNEPRRTPPALHAAAARCVEARVAQAAILSPLSLVRRALEVTLASAVVRRFPDLAAPVKANLEEVGRMEEAAQERPWELDRGALFPEAQLRAGEPTVDGPLPAQVVKHTVERNLGRFRSCYQTALDARSDLGGQITVHFTIDREGAATRVGGAGPDVRDPSFVTCVVRSFQGLEFPRPDGRTVAVTLPLLFSPG